MRYLLLPRQAFNPACFVKDPKKEDSPNCFVLAVAARSGISVWMTSSVRPVVVFDTVVERDVLDLSWCVLPWRYDTPWQEHAEGDYPSYNTLQVQRRHDPLRLFLGGRHRRHALQPVRARQCRSCRNARDNARSLHPSLSATQLQPAQWQARTCRRDGCSPECPATAQEGRTERSWKRCGRAWPWLV